MRGTRAKQLRKYAEVLETTFPDFVVGRTLNKKVVGRKMVQVPDLYDADTTVEMHDADGKVLLDEEGNAKTFTFKKGTQKVNQLGVPVTKKEIWDSITQTNDPRSIRANYLHLKRQWQSIKNGMVTAANDLPLTKFVAQAIERQKKNDALPAPAL